MKHKNPGQALKHHLRAEGWTQEDLAEIIGVSKKHVNEMVANKQPLNLIMAMLLGEAFGTSPKFWVKLNTKHQLSKRRQELHERTQDVKLRSFLYKNFPIREMMQKHWIESVYATEKIAEELKYFWQDSDLEKIVAREGNQRLDSTRTFMQKIKRERESLVRLSFQPEKIEELLSHLPAYSAANNGIKVFIDLLREAGVRFFYLPPAGNVKIDGAIIADKHPAIAFTARLDSIDAFWITMAHLLSHLSLWYRKEGLEEYVYKLGDSSPERVTRLAMDKLHHPQIMSFFSDSLNYIKSESVEKYAKQTNIHPSLVVGLLRLSRHGSQMQVWGYQEKVRHHL